MKHYLVGLLILTSMILQGCSQQPVDTKAIANYQSQTPSTGLLDSPLSSDQPSYDLGEGAQLSVLLRLSVTTNKSQSVDWRIRPEVSNLGLVPSVDFTATSGTLNIGPMANSVNFDISAKLNFSDSVDRSYLVDFNYPGSKPFTLKIVIKDFVPNGPLASPQPSYDLNEGAQLTVPMALSMAPTSTVNVQWSIRPDSSNAGLVAADDFTMTSGVLGIPAMATAINFSVTAKLNATLSSDRTYIVEFSYPNSKPVSFKIVIKNYVPVGPVSASQSTYTVTEGGLLLVALEVSQSLSTTTLVSWVVRPDASNPSLVATNDFIVASGTIGVVPGSVVYPFSILTKDNLISASNKIYNLEFTASNTKPISLKIVIQDNDSPTLSGSGLHNCLLKDGGVKCWGFNGNGELGEGTTINRATPTDVVSMGSNVTSLSAGGHTTCAVKNGAAFCWGRNHVGQIGNGIAVGGATTAPQAVLNMQDSVSKVVAGPDSSCGIKNGALFCWGNNANGTLGNGTSVPSYTPVPVTDMGSGVKDVDINVYYSYGACATKADANGNVGAYCWGYNGYGQIGDGSRTHRWTPVAVTGLESGVTSIGLGDSYACALKDGSIYCWGYNGYGQLGQGDTTDRSAATKLNFFNGKTIKKLAVGGQSVCALVDNNGTSEAYCWGGNSNGQLGLGNFTGSSTPQRILALDGASDINPSGRYDANTWAATTFAIVGNKVMATGNNAYGQLGNSTIGGAERSTFAISFGF